MRAISRKISWFFTSSCANSWCGLEPSCFSGTGLSSVWLSANFAVYRAINPCSSSAWCQVRPKVPALPPPGIIFHDSPLNKRAELRSSVEHGVEGLQKMSIITFMLNSFGKTYEYVTATGLPGPSRLRHVFAWLRSRSSEVGLLTQCNERFKDADKPECLGDFCKSKHTD